MLEQENALLRAENNSFRNKLQSLGVDLSVEVRAGIAHQPVSVVVLVGCQVERSTYKHFFTHSGLGARKNALRHWLCGLMHLLVGSYICWWSYGE